MLLDTNAVFLPVRTNFPLEPEIERLVPGATIAVPAVVVGELERLVARREADAGLALAYARRFPEIAGPGRGDTGVLEAAVRLGATVVTADRGFQARLRSAGVDALVPRDRHRLELRKGDATPSRTRRRSRAVPPRGNS